MTMYRMQILIEPDQRRHLEAIARRERRTLSDVTRRALQLGLNALERQQDVWERRQQVLNALRAIRECQPLYQGDLLNEIRQERDDEIAAP